MVTKQNYLKTLQGNKLLTVLNSYSTNVINVQPFTERDLLERYFQYTDPLLEHVRLMTVDNVFVLGNEARAMLGHIADYRTNPENRKNLSDAYGHFRRLNLDAFKIICDKLDQFLFTYLKKHYHYDYRDVNHSFLTEYANKYFAAQEAYFNAQAHERTGSDRFSGNIINEYFVAAKLYVELFAYLQDNRKGIEKTKWITIIKLIGEVTFIVLGFFESILS